MREYLTILLPFQHFYIPVMLVLAMWATWRTVVKGDLAVGLAFYLALVLIVDSFLNTGLFIPGMEKGSVRFSEICAAFLVFRRPAAGPRHISYGIIRYLVGLYFVLLFLAALRSDPVMYGVFEFRREIVAQIIAFVIALRGLRSPEDYRRFFMCLMALTLIVAIFVFWDLFFDRWLIFSNRLYKPEYGASRRHGRYGSFFLNPNLLGSFTILIFPAAFLWMLNEKVRSAKLLGGIGILAVAFCLVETQSRGPLIAFAAALPLLLLGPGGSISRTKRLAVFIPFALTFFLLMPGFFEHATSRFDTLEQEMSVSSRTRQSTWDYTWRIIGNNSISGIGYGENQFIRTMQAYGFEEEFGQTTLHHPHNAYLQMAVYAGYPAVLAFLFANCLLLLSGLRVLLQPHDNEDSLMVLGPVVGIAAFLIVIYPHNHMFAANVGSVYWVFFGLLLSLATKANATVKVPQVEFAFMRPPAQAGGVGRTTVGMSAGPRAELLR